MVQIIAGEKGKGKTKILIDNVNKEIQTVSGNIVYLDKQNKHMYELNNKIRLINVKDYFIHSCDAFLGFLCGIISQDHDLEKVYLDSFLNIACIDANQADTVLKKLNQISDTFHVDFILSISVSKDYIPKEYEKDIIVSL